MRRTSCRTVVVFHPRNAGHYRIHRRRSPRSAQAGRSRQHSGADRGASGKGGPEGCLREGRDGQGQRWAVPELHGRDRRNRSRPRQIEDFSVNFRAFDAGRVGILAGRTRVAREHGRKTNYRHDQVADSGGSGEPGAARWAQRWASRASISWSSASNLTRRPRRWRERSFPS